MKEEIKSTYKSDDTEEWLDRVWTRPIGYAWALLFRRLRVHPNTVTVLSMIIGAASAFLIYTYSLQELGWIGVVPAIIYAALGGIRLARFNLNTGVIHGYFQGMPIPNGGCLIATYVISGVHLPAWLIGIFVVALGYHLVSKVHNPDFKGASPDVLHKSALAISLIFGAVVLVFVDWHLVFTMPFLLYIVFGLVNTAMNAASAR